MTSTEWNRQWQRLANQFKASADADMKALSAEWFGQLKHYHVDAVEAGITTLIGQATDTFWPPLGKLKQAIQARLSAYERTKNDCSTCGGTTWVEATPWKSHGRVYTGFQRCPDCGVPAPNYKPVGQRDELTAAEFVAWRNGELQEQPVPTAPSNHSALEALRALNPRRGRMAKAIEGAPKTKEGAA